MKRISFLLLALLLALPMLFGCGGAGESDGGERSSPLIGAWISEEISPTDTVSNQMLYAFAENGHMLYVDLRDNTVTYTLAAHYEYIDGMIHIRENGKPDGVLIAKLEDDVLTLSLSEQDQDDSTTGKRIVFARQEFKESSSILGNWVYDYTETNGTVVSRQFAFQNDGRAALGIYEDSDMVDYKGAKYAYGEGELVVEYDFVLAGEDQSVKYRVGFPFEGFMTLEELNGNGEVTKIYPYRKIIIE